MIPFEQAQAIMADHIRPLGIIRVPVVDAVGMTLAEDVVSDISMPPFHKSAMDGYAVREEDVRTCPVELNVLEIVPAGSWPTKPLAPGTCTKVMTGACVPDGTDRVVMVEHTEPVSENVVRILKAGGNANICREGEDLRAGQVALKAGHYIRPDEVSLLSGVGAVTVAVRRPPVVSILSTGDEVVLPEKRPQRGQIRDCNSNALLALVRQAGCPVRFLGIAPDRPAAVERAICEGLTSDIFLISGGVSVGDFDYVRDVLRKKGVQILFDSVAIKPGKPTTFGVHESGYIFGLPGNPVSTLVIFRLFVLTAIRRMMGDPRPVFRPVQATIQADLKKRPGRQSYNPAHLEWAPDGCWRVWPIPSHGSADLVAVSKSDAWVVLPRDRAGVKSGETVEVIVFMEGTGAWCHQESSATCV